MKVILIALCAVLLGGCCTLFPGNKWFGGCYIPCYRTLFQPVIYPPPKIEPNVTTPAGFKLDVDLVKWNLDLKKLDARMLAIETCVLQVMKENPTPTDEQRKVWGCSNKPWEQVPIKKDCVIIKVMDPVISKCQSEWQLLPNAPAPDALCAAKGLQVTAECPCRWRAGTVDDYKVLTPPALYLWSVVEIMTGCVNAWGSPFAKCMGKGMGYIQ